MQFPLTDQLIDRIVFAMEDQQHSYLADRLTGELTQKEELGALGREEEPAAEAQPPPEEIGEAAALDGAGQKADRWVPLPAWTPADGFHLMERFVLKLRNPIFAEMLREALSSGQGVFRRFKDILHKNRELERLWFTFKDREMRRVVEQWYEAERELAGLERQATGGEPPVELVASDFALRRGEPRHVEPALKLDQKAWAELLPEGAEAASESMYRSARQELPPLLDRRSLFLVAELPQGEFAGFVWAVREEQAAAGAPVLRLVQLAVRKHFRGMGLATLLLQRLLHEAREAGYAGLLATLRGPALVLEPLFSGLGFSQRAVEMGFDLASPE